MLIKLYITINRNNNIHLNIIDETGHTLFKKSYGCVDKSSKLKLIGVQKLFNLASQVLEKTKNDSIIIIFNGTSIQRFLFLKDFLSKAITVSKIFYVSKKAFNGCRIKKQRRLLFFGRMSEGFKVPVLKTGRSSSTRVRIPFRLCCFNFNHVYFDSIVSST